MRSGGRIGFEQVAWFNGGLFNNDDALPLEKDDIALTLVAANLDCRHLGLMKDAFDEAWPKIRIVENDKELTRGLLASAILDQVNEGTDDRETIAACAVATLAVARNISH
jgi:hypothetical protein